MTRGDAPDRVDRNLADRVLRARDAAAFGELYARHTTYLYRFALRLTAGDEAAAEDLVHDAWVRAVEQLGEFEWRSSLRTWIGAILVAFARTRFRVELREVAFDDSGASDVDPGAVVLDRLDLRRALSAIPPGYRLVLVAHDIEGFTHEEIGGMLGISPGTSKSQLFHARAAMRRVLGPRE